MYSFRVLVESGVLQAIVKFKSRVGQRSEQECVGVSNHSYVVYIIYDYAKQTRPFLLQNLLCRWRYT